MSLEESYSSKYGYFLCNPNNIYCKEDKCCCIWTYIGSLSLLFQTEQRLFLSVLGCMLMGSHLWATLAIVLDGKIQCRRGLIQCKERNKSDILIGQQSKELTGSQSNASLECRNKIWKFASKTMSSILSRLSFATAAEKQLKQQKHCKKHCFLVVGLEKVVFRKRNCWGNRKLQADPA